MLTDLEIAHSVKMKPVSEIAEKLAIPQEALNFYGNNIAKINRDYLKTLADKPDGKLILVTATTPTPAGEGKTTVTVGLGQALALRNKKAMVCIREPSLGPCFGIKGGAAGGGYSQVVPMEQINLHFTGDIHAIGTAHNLLAAMVDNHIHQGNALGIVPKTIRWRRVLDINERALRSIVIGLGGKADGVTRQSGFDITVSSEVMAILCLATDLRDLKERLGRIVVGERRDGSFVTAADLKAHGSMAVLLKDALDPNLVQTLEGVPAFVHGGPFANIAHGTNTVVATKAALKLADIVITEAGFGSDLGAEKFFNIVSRQAGLNPAAVVLVTTVRSLKYQGGAPMNVLGTPDTEVLQKGLGNLEAHLENITGFGLPVVVAINRFGSDSEEELALVKKAAASFGAKAVVSEVFARGGEGGLELADAILEAVSGEQKPFKPRYDLGMSFKEKIEILARTVYGADGVDFVDGAEKELAALEAAGYRNLPVCIAKTPLSLTDDPVKKGRPKGFRISIREVRLSAGAGFIVAISGQIMIMPGLPKVPAAERIDIDDEGNISGLF
jgi:formate--tetrahydrofolate ligase